MRMTLEEISNITSINKQSLNIYLCNYRFNKYYRAGYYDITKKFLEDFGEYLELKRRVVRSKRGRLINPVERLETWLSLQNGQ